MTFRILQEDGGSLKLEDVSGFLILEDSTPDVVSTGADDDLWWIHAQQVEAARKAKAAPKKKPLTGDGLILFLDRDDWTIEELEILLATDLWED